MGVVDYKEFDSSLRIAKAPQTYTESQQRRDRGEVIWEGPSILCPRVSPTPRQRPGSLALHSPPPPRKCFVVASPSAPSPPPSWAPGSRPGVRPGLRQLTGGGAGTPARSAGRRGRSPLQSLSWDVPLRGPANTGPARKRREAPGARSLPNPQKPGIQPDGSAWGEGRPESQTRAPPSGASSLSHPEALSGAGRHLQAGGGFAAACRLFLPQPESTRWRLWATDL